MSDTQLGMVLWASFALRMLAALGVVVVAIAVVRKAQALAGWALAGAAVIEAFDAGLWRIFRLTAPHLVRAFSSVLVALQTVSLLFSLAVGALVVLAMWRLARNVRPR